MSVVNKAVKCRLDPTVKQSIMFLKTFGCCRKVYNLMLEDKIKYYKENKTMLKTTPAQYKTEYPFLKEVDSLALANEQLNLESAYTNFFKNPKTGFPKYKSRNKDKASYTTNNQNGSIRIEKNKVRIPKIGFVRIKLHRIIPEHWILKSITVSMTKDGKYYYSLLFEYEDTVAEKSNLDMNAIGLDYKSDGLYVDSNGVTCGSPKYYRKGQKCLTKAQRKLRHKNKNSNNYRKACQKIAKAHQHIANQRKDFLHKKSTEIANQYDLVCVEDLNMKAISNASFGNGKATMDNGWGMFTKMLEYKLADRGKRLVCISKWYPSSQTCSCCGCVNPAIKDLSIRKWICPDCGEVHDRDLNAAINIKNEGIRLYLS